MEADATTKLHRWDIGAPEKWPALQAALVACQENPTEDNWKRLVSEIDDAIEEAKYWFY